MNEYFGRCSNIQIVRLDYFSIFIGDPLKIFYFVRLEIKAVDVVALRLLLDFLVDQVVVDGQKFGLYDVSPRGSNRGLLVAVPKVTSEL